MGARGPGGGQEEGPRSGRREEERQAERQTSRIWGQKMRMQIKCHVCFASTFKELSEVKNSKKLERNLVTFNCLGKKRKMWLIDL